MHRSQSNQRATTVTESADRPLKPNPRLPRRGLLVASSVALGLWLLVLASMALSR